MMRYKIITDSTCDLPHDVLKQHDITALPLHISKGDSSYLDGVEIRPGDIFAYAESGQGMCATASVNIGEYADCFQRFSPLYDAVIVITLGSGFSGAFQNAGCAAQDFTNVYVVDSRNLSPGQGMLVLRAAELARQSLSPEALCGALEEMATRIRSSFILGQVDYLHKGGRCSAVAALSANVLQLKPCIEVSDGRMIVGKRYRGDFVKAIRQYVAGQLASCTNICTDYLLLDVSDTERAAVYIDAARQAIREDGRFQAILETRAGCTVACHCGPDTLGITFLAE